MNTCSIFPTRAVYKALLYMYHTIIIQFTSNNNNYLNETTMILFTHFTSTIQLIVKPRPINNTN